MKSEDIKKAKRILKYRIYNKYLDKTTTEDNLSRILKETLNSEMSRLNNNPTAINREKDLKFWTYIKDNFDTLDKSETIKNIIDNYFNEICGRFDKNIYDLSYNIVKRLLPLIFSRNSIFRMLNPFRVDENIDDILILKGELGWIKDISNKGTLVLLPTHSSNLDSMIVGTAISKMGLPPFLYGAGINLYTNPVLAFFMSRLGAYTVDREKSNSLYKMILKEFATITMEFGYHNIFFPGGGRSRSNIIEKHIKLGLIGSAFNAYINNIKNDKLKPDIYFVPVTINYHNCLEASTMIDHYIRKSSPSIVINDEFSEPQRITDFIFKALNMNLKVYLNLAPPLDIFGNQVDRNGKSIDSAGKIYNPKDILFDEYGNYILKNEDNKKYIKNLGNKIVEYYSRYNVIFSNNILAYAVYYIAKKKLMSEYNKSYNEKELYHILRDMENIIKTIPSEIVIKNIDLLLIKLKELEDDGKICLADEVKVNTKKEIMELAIKIFSAYHKSPILKIDNDDNIYIKDANLTLYYKNRLEGYDLENIITYI